MEKVTGLKTGGREKRISVFLDGRYAFSVGAEVLATERIEIGQELSAERIEMLVRSERLRRCLDAAMRYLGYRPRSESELRARLRQRGFDEGAIEATIDRLKERRLLDDEAFAQFWRDNRESFRPRSQRLTRLELRRKGVDAGIIEQVVRDIDDGESAYRAALSRGQRWAGGDFEEFRRRMGAYLRRRGFGFRDIDSAIKRAWELVSQGSPEELPDSLNIVKRR